MVSRALALETMQILEGFLGLWSVVCGHSFGFVWMM